MPVDPSDLIPRYPLHWTTIVHYLLILMAIAILTVASDKASIIFTLVLAFLVLLIGADIYSYLLRMDRIFIFLIRVLMLALPIVIAGMAQLEQVRSLSILMAALALPILVSTFMTCWIPMVGDPRIAHWCF